MKVIITGSIPLSPQSIVHGSDKGYVGKQPVAWKEYCADYWLKNSRKAWIGETDCLDITENGVKHRTINQSFSLQIKFRPSVVNIE